MKFQSTRDQNKTEYTSAQVIKQGLSDDGGLFVPESIPTITLDEINEFTSLAYPELAARILGLFLTDYTQDELLNDCTAAYAHSSFTNDPCPLVEVNTNEYSLELWHGPTCAFKDMALQIMPRLLSRALTKTNEDKTALVLVATSGDTGKAALEGYKDIPQIKISVFYPENGVSSVQKLQMQTQLGSNVNVCAVKGNFDDIQSGVKYIFNNETYADILKSRGYFLSSANSINFGRLAPQIVYYVKAYCDLVKCGKIELGDSINVCVPTGNFGNILAAYISKLMGLPIAKLICASNSNNILTDFLQSGKYDRNRDFHLTMSPSMDILISSNLERLLYMIAGADKTKEWMISLSSNGIYQVDKDTLTDIQKTFVGYYADEATTSATIKKYYEDHRYLMDTHTAVAFSALNAYHRDTQDSTVTVVASTASPYKFAADVYNSLFGNKIESNCDSIAKLSSCTQTEIPAPLRDLDKKSINFNAVTSPDKIFDEVLEFIG